MKQLAMILLFLITILAGTVYPDNLNKAIQAAKGNPKLEYLYGIVVMKNGSILAEGYFHGWNREKPVNIKSASKSVLSALTGIAIEEKKIPGIQTQVISIFPEYINPLDKLKKKLCIFHLLTMSSGLDSASDKDFFSWTHSGNPLMESLKANMISVPGSKFAYSTADTHILSSILSQLIGQDLLEYAKEKIFTPMGIDDVNWEKSHSGQYWGGNNFYLKPYDFAKFGQLYLNGGVWNGVQLVPKAWVKMSTTKQIKPKLWSPFPLEGYGFLWWLINIDGNHAIVAWGRGGQYLILIPDRKIVIAVVSDWNADYSNKYYHALAAYIKSVLKTVQ